MLENKRRTPSSSDYFTPPTPLPAAGETTGPNKTKQEVPLCAGFEGLVLSVAAPGDHVSVTSATSLAEK